MLHTRDSIGRAFALALATLLSGSACSDDSTDPADAASVGGSVRLVAPATDEIGTVLGEQRVTDLDEATVRLKQGTEVVATGETDRGSFRFSGVDPGEYTVELVLTPSFALSSASFTVSGTADVAVDTLVVGLPAGLVTYPNPFPRGHGVGLEFTVPSGQPALTTSVRAFRVDGTLVWRYTYEAPPGFQHIHWAGHDSTFVDLPAGVYWVSVEWPGSVLATFAVNEG
jgi:hypothetical protein